MDSSPPSSSVHGILQARILEWVAISFSRGFSRPRDQTHVSYVSYIGRQVLYHQCHLGRSRDTVGQFEEYCHVNRRRQWHPTPVLLPGKFHGQRSLVGCSPWGRWGLDVTKRFHFLFSLSCIGEGNGNPLQRFAWRIPGTGEPGGLPSMGSHRVGHDWSDLAAAAAILIIVKVLKYMNNRYLSICLGL